MLHDTARRWLLLILVAALALRLTLVLVLPFDGAPDERHRYEIAARVYATGRVPRYGIETGHHFVVKPVFGLRLNAFVARLLPGKLPLFRKLRFGSALVSVAVVALAFAAVRNLWPARPAAAVALAAVLAFHPQFAFLGSYLNHDAYTVFANALVFGLLTVVHRRGRLTAWLAAALGGALGLLFLGRENGYAGFILAAGYAAYLLRSGWRSNGRGLAAALAVFLAFPAVFYLHQYATYGKAYLPVVVGSGIAWVPPEVTVAAAYTAGSRPSLEYPVFRLSWSEPVHWSALLVTLFISSFGGFGYMDVGFPPPWYVGYLGFTVAGVVGLCRCLRPSRGAADPVSRSRRWLLGSSAVAMVALVAAVIRHNFAVIFQPQGRYLLPLVVPAMLLLFEGWRRTAPQREMAAALATLGVGFFVLGGSYAVWMLARLYV